MTFTPKDWKDYPDTSTPLTAAALEDLETRVAAYADTVGAASQPLDSDLTAIAALTTTSFGRSLLALADAAAARTALALGSAATQNTSAFDASGAATSAVATHEADTTNVHGIADTSALDTVSARNSALDAHMASGTLAARPAAATYGVGRYFATDKLIDYVSDGSSWSRATPIEIWSDTFETSLVSLATSRVDIAALEPVTFDVIAGFAVIVEFASPYNSQVQGGYLVASISDNAGADASANVKEQGITGRAYTTGNIQIGPFRVVERITTPGTYTRKPQIQAGGFASGASAGIVASAAIHPRFRVYETPLA